MQFIEYTLNVNYRLRITWVMHQQLRECKVEEKLHLGVGDQTTVEYHCFRGPNSIREADQEKEDSVDVDWFAFRQCSSVFLLTSICMHCDGCKMDWVSTCFIWFGFRVWVSSSPARHDLLWGLHSSLFASMCVKKVSDIRQIDINAAEPLVSDPNYF
jgi:hypothetical protein